MTTIIADMPAAPSRSSSGAAFPVLMDAWLAAFPSRITSMNAQSAETNANALSAASSLNATNMLGTSTSSLVLGTGSKVFTVAAGKGWVTNQPLFMVHQTDPTKYMLGTVASYSGTTLTVTVTLFGGTGTVATWYIGLTTMMAAGVFTGDSGSGGSTGEVPAPASGDAAANKFLRADGLWTAPGFVQIATASPVGVTSVDFTNIPQVYNELLVLMELLKETSNATASLNLLHSTDNLSTTATQGISGSITLTTDSLSGVAIITGYRKNFSQMKCGVTGNVTASPSSALGTQTNSTLRHTGGINALRIAISANTFGSGTVTLFGR